MGLTCQPNFNGPQPGHCVLHYVDKTSGARFSHHVSAIQNRAMDTPRLPQKIRVDQNELNKSLITLNKNIERLNISLPSLSNKKNELQKQLTQAQSLLSKVLAEQCAAKKETAEKISIANEKEKYFIKKWAYKAIMDTCHTVKDRIRDGDMVYSTIAQSQHQWQDWVDFRTKLIQKENAVKRLDDVNLNVNDIRKYIDKITLEIERIDAKTPVPVAKPTATAAAPAVKSAANPPVQKSDNLSLSNLVGHNFLSHEQQAQKSKELAECQTALCKIGKEAKWAITDLALSQASTPERLAGYMAPKGVPDTYKAARLANQ